LLVFFLENGHPLLEGKDFFEPQLIFLTQTVQQALFLMQLLSALLQLFLQPMDAAIALLDCPQSGSQVFLQSCSLSL
jgi:hypothetical protein